MFNLIPWSRIEEEMVSGRFADLRREFDALTSQFFGAVPSELPGRVLDRTFSPAIDLCETEHEFLVRADLPGIDQKDVKVELGDGVLTIQGEKKEEKNDGGASYCTVERSFGVFSRSFVLAYEIAEDKIEAKYKDGVLSLRLPKANSGKKKLIKIAVPS
ncbi:MAG TPA: Hsp20/alpha crystallin family protein [Desulfomonilaceae bacterium]|nr:Hsp20/alpha crystallin family protein [Desulfomonilaceae bacterium]HVN80292.1 Hsp20/alpha crystallin family protein [Terriglobia bacterium]